MDDRVIAAIVTSSVALFLGVINAYLNYQNRLKINKNNLEVESMRFETNKKLLLFEKSLDNKENDKVQKEEIKSLILKTIQGFKDASYLLEETGKKETSLYISSLRKFHSALQDVIVIYKETYMDVDDELRSEFHEIKNHLHFLNSSVELILFRWSKDKELVKKLNNDEILELFDSMTTLQSKMLRNES